MDAEQPVSEVSPASRTETTTESAGGASTTLYKEWHGKTFGAVRSKSSRRLIYNLNHTQWDKCRVKTVYGDRKKYNEGWATTIEEAVHLVSAFMEKGLADYCSDCD